MTKKLLAAFLFAASSIGLECAFFTKRKNDWNIRKFVNTSEHIWTYSTSDCRQIECKMDAKVSATKTSLVFNRSYYIGTERIHDVLEGQFFEKQKDRMAIRRGGGSFMESEYMLYYHKNGGCAVFRVKTQNHGFYLIKMQPLRTRLYRRQVTKVFFAE
ncbi:uncharacterized protein LOC125946933 isoform X2 [Dermacentor silvarum]|uniref:uncharacterized protein LOC125946933 isoform X2 n=1 Tax=Dermacentor silvarum TaxID=543639 RepID=UPI002101197A|nr:uncharacterized protein LOC125946933 isoform X2 [Dermacentor silvarum]